jgi:hypothetical protein
VAAKLVLKDNQNVQLESEYRFYELLGIFVYIRIYEDHKYSKIKQYQQIF